MTSRVTTYMREVPAWARDMHSELPPRQPEDVTVSELADYWRVTNRATRDRLKRLSRDGLLLELMVFDPNHPKKRVLIFRPAPGVKLHNVIGAMKK